MVKVPLPLSVVLPVMSKKVLSPPLFRLRTPAFMIEEPATVKVVLSEIPKLSVLKASWRVPVEPLLTVTTEFAVLMHVLLLVVGVPLGVQLVVVFQLPLAPPLQVKEGEVQHCAKAECGHKISASNAINKTRTSFSFAAYFTAAKKDRFMSSAPDFVICVAWKFVKDECGSEGQRISVKKLLL